MHEESKKTDLTYLLLYPYMAVAFIPWLKYRVQFRFVLPFVLLWLSIAFVTRREVVVPLREKKCLGYLILFLGLFQGISLISQPFGHSEGMSYAESIDLLLSIFSLLIFHFSICNGRRRELRALMIFSYLCLAVAAIMTIKGQDVVQGGSRILTAATSDVSSMSELAAARDVGIGGYGYAYGIGLLVFPMLACTSLMSRLMKVFIFCLSALFLVMIYHAGYSILMIGSFLAGILYLLKVTGFSRRVMKLIGTVTLVIFVTFLTNPQIMSFTINTFQKISTMISKEEYQQRTESLAEAASGSSNTYVLLRSELYWNSWREFLENPIFGIGRFTSQEDEKTSRLGGHSLIFDVLGAWGLFGFIIFLLIFVWYIRYMRGMSVLVLGAEWWPSFYIFMVSAGMIAFVNPLNGYLIFGDFLLFIPALPVFFRRSAMTPPRASPKMIPPLMGNGKPRHRAQV